MSLLGLIEKRSTLANPDSFLLGLFGGRATDSGLQVSEQNALTLTTVYACVNVITEAMLTLPVKLYRLRADGGHDIATDIAAAQLLTLSPNDEMSVGSFISTAMGWVLTWGNGFAEIERNNAGEAIALHPLAPNRIIPRRRSQNPVSGAKDWRIEYFVSRKAMVSPYLLEAVVTDPAPIDRDNMLHFAGLGFDGVMGYSPVAMAREAIGLGLAAQAYGARWFGNSGIPSGVLEAPGTVRDPDKLRKAWNEKNTGANQRGTAVLEDGIKFHSIGIPPEDSQFLETRKFQRSEIAGIYRVPPHMIGDLEKSTNNNIEHQGMDFVTYCLMGWLCRVEQELDRKLLTVEQRKAGYFFAFNVDQILRGDMKSRYDAYAVARQWGWASADDVRARERMSALPNKQGAVYLIPMNMMDASKINEPKEVPAAVPVVPKPEAEPTPQRKLTDNFRALLIDAAGRAVHKETTALRRAAKKPATFAADTREFYAGHDDHLRTVLIPVASAYGDLIGAGFPKVRDTVEGLVRNLIAQSMADLSKPGADVESLMKQWEDERAKGIADSILKGIA